MLFFCLENDQTGAYLESLGKLKEKLNKKRQTIKGIIEKKIEDNLKEINKWKDLLATIVDECIDEKLNQIASQVCSCIQMKINTLKIFFFPIQNKKEDFLRTTQTEMNKVVQERDKNLDEDEDETEEPRLSDLLALNLRLEPDYLTPEEANEVETDTKKDFTVLLNEGEFCVVGSHIMILKNPKTTYSQKIVEKNFHLYRWDH